MVVISFQRIEHCAVRISRILNNLNFLKKEKRQFTRANKFRGLWRQQQSTNLAIVAQTGAWIPDCALVPGTDCGQCECYVWKEWRDPLSPAAAPPSRNPRTRHVLSSKCRQLHGASVRHIPQSSSFVITPTTSTFVASLPFIWLTDLLMMIDLILGW